MIFERQKHLLAFLGAHGGDLGRLDFQKLLFLYCQYSGENPIYDFVPYKYGGFSFTSYADKRRLTEQGFLADDERLWKLTETGRKAAVISSTVRLKMDTFSKQHSNLRGDALVAETYRRFPFYATQSEIAQRVLAGDNKALDAIKHSRPTSHIPGICTIGYEGRTLERYLTCLLKDGVTMLCDVRRNPLSRKYGFSKSTLSKSCQGVGIKYEHLPELGIATEKRRTLDTQADYDSLFAEYERNDLPQQGDALETIQRWMDAGNRVALTCFEHAPEQCHRHCVAEAMAQRNRHCHIRHL